METELEVGSTEKLVTMVNETANTLNKIWDEVGFSENERQAQLQALVEQVHHLCEEKVIDEETVRDTFVSSIEENKAKAIEAAKRLGEPSPNVENDEDGSEIANMALTLQLAYFEQLSTKLDIKVCAQESNLNTIHESVLNICQALELNAEKEWASCGGENGTSNDLSDAAFVRFNAKLDELNAKKSSRIEQMTEVVTQCQGLFSELGSEAQTPLEHQIKGSLDLTGQLTSYLPSEACVGIGASMLEKVIERTNELVEERDKRSAYLMDLGEKVSKLWELLSISEAEQIAFEESLTGGLSDATISAGEKELSRLEALKKIKMVEIIGGRRNQIEHLWDQTAATSEQRNSFKHFTVSNENAFTDELLELHDQEVSKLESRLEAMQPLFKLSQKYEEAVALRAELEELQKDKDRLKGRGSAKQLQLEEQMGKKIKQLPKIIENLTKQVGEWETAEGVEFNMKDSTGMGRRCLDVVAETEDSWARRKEEAKKAGKRPSSNSGSSKGSDLPHKQARRPSKVPLGENSATKS